MTTLFGPYCADLLMFMLGLLVGALLYLASCHKESD